MAKLLLKDLASAVVPSKLSFLSGIFLLTVACGASAQSSQTTLSVGAVVRPAGCTAKILQHAQRGAQATVECASSLPVAPFYMILTQHGGIAGPDDADGDSITVAY